jgi:superfamily II DNA or RNA helicase
MTKCKIIIKDEVNCKIENLELDARRALMKKFEFEIPGARYLPAVKLGRWNGKVSYFSLAGSSYINLLEKIIPVLEDYGYDIELEDLRTYSNNFSFAQVSANSFSDRVWPKGHPAQGEPIILRDYQVEIINNFLANPQCLQEIATGAGKTIMTAALSKSVESYGRSIVIVPNKSLVTQTEEDYVNMGLDVGVYFGDRKEYNKTHTICTWQSLNNLLKNTKAGEAEIPIKEFIEGVVCVMVDECFDGDSLVLTTQGYVPIKHIKAGDKIINYSESTSTFKEDTVIEQHVNLTKSSNEKMYELEFDSGEKIKVTGNHKFLTTDGWMRADELNENHEIITPIKLGNYMKLIKRTEIDKPNKVYNLHIENDHNYIVNNSVVSNCHMAKADALKTLLTGVFSQVPIRWGLTGTIPKAEYERTSLLVSLGPVINKLAASELQDLGVLAKCHVNIIQLKDDVDFSNYQSELKHLLENERRLDKIAQLIDKINETGNTLVLIDRVNAGKELIARIPEAVFVSGETKLTERKEEYDEIKTSERKIIVATYGVAAVGINLPRIFNLVLIEPGKSFVRVIQSIGRGIRKAEDKDFVTIYDITSNCKFAKRHLTQRKAYYKEAKYEFTMEKLSY